jgi:hypothetical protein
MTRERLNQLRELSQLARDHYYAHKAVHGDESLSGSLSLLVRWKQAQQQAEDAVLQWIKQGCREVHFLKYPTEGTLFIHGKAVGTFKEIRWSDDLDFNP